jgi:hypothetical protein
MDLVQGSMTSFYDDDDDDDDDAELWNFIRTGTVSAE